MIHVFATKSSFILNFRIHQQWIHSQLTIQIMDSLSIRKAVSGFMVKSQKSWFKVHSPIQSNILKYYSEISRWNHSQFANKKSFLQIHYEFIIFFCGFTMIFFYLLANFLWIQYFIREFTMDSLSISWIHYEFTTYFVYSLWIQLVCREYTMNTSRIYLFHEFTFDSLSFLRIHYLFHEYVINVFPAFTNKRELLRCHHILVRLYLFRAFAIFFDQIVCKVYYMLNSDEMSFSKFCYYYSWLIRVCSPIT